MADTEAVRIVMARAGVTEEVAELVVQDLRLASWAPVAGDVPHAARMEKWHVPDAFYEDLWTGQQEDIHDTWPALYTPVVPRG